MSRRKRSSIILEKAQRRVASIKAIDPTLDLGNGLSLNALSTLATDIQQKLETYNTALSTIDQSALAIQTGERSLSELSERMLLGIASKYGKYSEEYIMAGGKPRKTSQRRTSQSEPQPAPTPIIPATTPSSNGKTALVS